VFDEELLRRLRRLARRDRVSLNQAVLRLLRKGAGLGAERDEANVVGSSLDGLFGTWSAKETAAVERALEDFEWIDFPTAAV
jgi:hypothetical protein